MFAQLLVMQAVCFAVTVFPAIGIKKREREKKQTSLLQGQKMRPAQLLSTTVHIKLWLQSHFPAIYQKQIQTEQSKHHIMSPVTLIKGNSHFNTTGQGFVALQDLVYISHKMQRHIAKITGEVYFS